MKMSDLAKEAEAMCTPDHMIETATDAKADDLLGWTRTSEDLPKQGVQVILGDSEDGSWAAGELGPNTGAGPWFAEGIHWRLSDWPLWRAGPELPGGDRWTEEDGQDDKETDGA